MRVLISSDTILNATEEFLDWRVFGFFFSFVNVMFRALFIGITRTKVLTLNAVVMALTNVLLDYLLIFGNCGFPELGIKGAAIASVMAEGVSIVFLSGLYPPDGGYKEICIESIPVVRYQVAETGVKYFYIYHVTVFFISLSTYFMLFVAVEHLGQRELAIANIVRSVYIVLLIPVNSLSTATNSFVSNSIGAGHTDQVIPIIRRLSYISLGIVAVCVFLSPVFSPSAILSVYTNDASLIHASIPSLSVIAGALLIAAVANIVFNGVTGTGNTRSAFAMELVTLVFYTLFIYVAGMRLHLPVAICFSDRSCLLHRTAAGKV